MSKQFKPQDEDEISTRMQDFTVIQKIGDGAYSEVFKVKRLSDNKIYALKKVS